MSKLNFLLYPYDISNLFFLSFGKEFIDVNIAELASPNGWGYTGEDAGEKIGIVTGKIVTDDAISALARNEGLLLTESIFPLEEKYIDELINEAIKKNKLIINLRSLKEISLSLQNKNIKQYINLEPNDHIKTETNKLLLKNIEKPIVLVIGSGERCYKFDVQLLVRSIFIKNGYKVSQIGSKYFSEYFGFHSFPIFKFENSINITEKVKRFSDYVYYLDKKEKSDVIIIGVPGGISPYNEEYFNDFGYYNYIVSNAINPDFVIFNSIYTDFSEKYFMLLNNILKYKYNYPLNAIFLSNTYINWEATDDLHTLSYITLNKKLIDKEIIKYPNVYSLYSKGNIEKFAQKLIGTLCEYGECSKM